MASVVSRPSVDADASAYAFHNPATSTLAPVAASNSVVIHIPIASVPALPPLVPQLSVSAMPASAAPIQLPNAISVAPRAGAAATNFAASNPSPTNASPDSPAGGGPDSPKESSAFILSAAAYTAELERQKAILPALPTIEIAFRDVTVSTTVPIVDSGFETIGSKLINLITAAKLRNKNKTKTVRTGAVAACACDPVASDPSVTICGCLCWL